MPLYVIDQSSGGGGGSPIVPIFRDPAQVLHLIGNLGELALEALTPTSGDSYIVSAVDGDGSLAPGALAIGVGDLVTFNGVAWLLVLAASGGFPPADTRVVIASQTAPIAPYAPATDEGKIAVFDGASLTAALTAETIDGALIAINGENAVFENRAFIYDGVVPTGTWNILTGLSPSFSETTADKILAGLVTVADFDQGGPAITNTPLGNGVVKVTVGGLMRSIGSGTRVGVDGYFSDDGGATAKAFGAIVAGDTFHWVGSNATFQLDATDELQYHYDA